MIVYSPQSPQWHRVERDGVLVHFFAASDSRLCADLQNEDAPLSLARIRDAAIKEDSNFALMASEGVQCFAACDCVRSVPIFYADTANGLKVSNSFPALWKALDSPSVSEAAIEEFHASGFTVANRTLCDQIRQLRAGEYLFQPGTPGQDLEIERYNSLEYNETTQDTDPSQRFDTVLTTLVHELATAANGRQIVLPLSGGRDSRLLLLLLRRAGYDNLTTFTYGQQGNAEAEVSKAVAKEMNVPWHFVEYDRDLVRKHWFDDQRSDFEKLAFNGCSLPVYQDYFAVRDLRMSGVIHEDALIVPGHSADFNAGSHLPSFIFEDDPVAPSKINEEMARKHFHMFAKHDKTAVRRALKDAMLSKAVPPLRAALALDRFNLAERQAKFIVNSCRAYEVLGLEWRMPFWDKRFVDFWTDVPLALRQDQAFYADYVEQVSHTMGLRIPIYSKPVVGTPKVRSALRRTLRLLPIHQVHTQRRLRIYRNAMVDPHWIFPAEFVAQCAAKGASLNGIFLEDIIKRTPGVFADETPPKPAQRNVETDA